MDKIIIAKTGDPWQDIGLVALYRDLVHIHDTVMDEDPLLNQIELFPGHLEFQPVEDGWEDLKEALKDRMKEKLNKIPLPPIELKLLRRNEWHQPDPRGFLDGRYKTTLSKDDVEWLRKDQDEMGNPKPSLSNPQKNPEMTNMRNFIGLRGDWEKTVKSYRQEIDDFVNHQSGLATGKKKTCPLCGRDADPKAFRPMNQNRNVLFNQHHAVSVRGYTSNVDKRKMCPTCNLLNLYSTIEVGWHPYFVSAQDITHLLIPETRDLNSLDALYRRIENQLMELQQDLSVTNYRSNLEELNRLARYRTLYISLLTVYYWMEHVRGEESNPYFPLSQRTRASLKTWLIPRFSKGQKVIFKHFSRISVDGRVFRLTRPVSYGKNREKKGDVLHEFLFRIRSSEPRWIDSIARGLVQRDLRLIGNSLFQILKAAKRDSRQNRVDTVARTFFPDYMAYLNTEVDPMLGEPLQSNLRSLGHIIGNHCADDVSTLTKLNNALSPESFIRALKDTLFLIYKKAQSSQKSKSPEPEEIRNIGAGKIDEILAQLNRENLPVIRDTLMIYVSISAFWALKDKKEKGSGSDD